MRSSRHNAPATLSGPGVHYSSPVRPRDARKTRIIVPMGSLRRASREQALRARLEALRHPPAAQAALQDASTTSNTTGDTAEHTNDSEMDWVDDIGEAPPSPPPPPPPAPPIPIPAYSSPARSARSNRHASWDILLPLLVPAFALFRQTNHGCRPSVISSRIQHECIASCGRPITANVQCLYITRQ
jgi:hypothetical protein